MLYIILFISDMNLAKEAFSSSTGKETMPLKSKITCLWSCSCLVTQLGFKARPLWIWIPRSFLCATLTSCQDMRNDPQLLVSIFVNFPRHARDVDLFFQHGCYYPSVLLCRSSCQPFSHLSVPGSVSGSLKVQDLPLARADFLLLTLIGNENLIILPK